MRTFQFNYKATFEGTVDVRAESKAEAKEILGRDFGLVSPSISSSNESEDEDEEGIVDWDFNVHPIKTLIS